MESFLFLLCMSTFNFVIRCMGSLAPYSLHCHAPNIFHTLKFRVTYWTTFQKHICSTKRCKQDNRSYDCLLEWLVKKKCNCLSLQCDKLQLIIEDDALEILGIYNDIYSHVILYYYIKLWIIVVHDYVIKKKVVSFKKEKNSKNIGYNIS